MHVKPKKYLGQHFLNDRKIAARIVDSLSAPGDSIDILEIGPGTGILTDILFAKYPSNTRIIEIDDESVDYLRKKYPEKGEQIIHDDFLKIDLSEHFSNGIKIIGNLPYNISSQIFFKVFENRNRVEEMVCMVQKEVANRIASDPGSKSYGILSVLMGTFYEIEYLFTVPPGVFFPVPKVHSAVIRFSRNDRDQLPCREEVFRKIVKQGFQNRRKTLRNALKTLNLPEQIRDFGFLDMRAEQLSVGDFIELSSKIDELWKK